MGTRSSVTAKTSTGEYKSIYVHWDGYPSGVGQTLLNHYTDQSKIEGLMALGDLSQLSESIEKPEGHSFKNPASGCCVAYGRDRGEEGVEAKAGQTVEEASKWTKDSWCEYNYLWDGKKWTCDGVDLAEAIRREESD